MRDYALPGLDKAASDWLMRSQPDEDTLNHLVYHALRAKGYDTQNATRIVNEVEGGQDLTGSPTHPGEGDPGI